jgi:hypothetical protein
MFRWFKNLHRKWHDEMEAERRAAWAKYEPPVVPFVVSTDTITSTLPAVTVVTYRNLGG